MPNQASTTYSIKSSKLNIDKLLKAIECNIKKEKDWVVYVLASLEMTEKQMKKCTIVDFKNIMCRK